MKREHWGSKVGVILAIAGSAVGLGNFLRFPVQMAGNGGGAFMVPYFIAFLLLGVPLIWIELAIGRFGGSKGYGSTPGMFDSLWSNPVSKYLGVLGILVPTIVIIYYCYIESWTLAYSFFSISGMYENVPDGRMRDFLLAYQGIIKNEYFSGIGVAYIFFIITLAANIFVLWKGIRGGIEKLARIGMPILFIMAIVLTIRVLSLGTPDPSKPDWNVLNGLAFMWVPNLTQLKSSTVWLAATGQMFFTLSIGFGIIHTYASYIRRNEDIALSGLATVSTNEFAEVILGGTIAIPISVIFFGPEATTAIAKSGSFNLGFQVLPNIFKMMPGGMIFGFFWFFLLFVAGITSSVSLSQPLVAFMQDSLKFSHKKAISILGVIIFVATQPIIFFLSKGFLDELDFWAGTFLLVVFAFVELVIVSWILKLDLIWDELNRGCEIKIPRIYYYIMKYVTPLYLLIILVYWFYDKAIDVFMLKGVPSGNIPYVLSARFLMLGSFIIICIMVHLVWKRKKKTSEAVR